MNIVIPILLLLLGVVVGCVITWLIMRHSDGELSGRFAELSQKALRENNETFIELAKAKFETFHQSAKGDLDQKQQAIDQIVKPLRESLDKVDEKIQDLENARAEAYGGLLEQVRTMAISQTRLEKETGDLVKALRTPHVRGRWGEIQLRRVVELAGMIKRCDFTEQQSVAREDGGIRPDLTIHLPGKRTIVVDAKVPFEAFYESISTTDDGLRLEKLKEHARLVKAHISKLGKRAYWQSLQPTPEFVLLFLPGESFYNAALEQDPELIEYGIREKVIIATPTTLIALLKAISYGWQQEERAANVEELGNLGQELCDRLRTFLSHFASIGNSLESALKAYNEGVGSLEARVLVTARKLKDRGAIGGEEIRSFEPITKSARILNFDEGGLFPDQVAGGAYERESTSVSLLNSKTAVAGDES